MCNGTHDTHTVIHTALGLGEGISSVASASDASHPAVRARRRRRPHRVVLTTRQAVRRFARHRRPVHAAAVLACRAADVVDHVGVPRTEGGGIGGELRRGRRCAAARGTAAARAATRRAAARATAARAASAQAAATRAAAARAAAARATAA